MALVVRCPTCGRSGPWFEGRFGPFCSERCKWVDLGKWLDEEHRISSPLKASDLEHLEDLGPVGDETTRSGGD